MKLKGGGVGGVIKHKSKGGGGWRDRAGGGGSGVIKHKSKGGGGWRDRAGGGGSGVIKHNHAKKIENFN